MGRRDTEDGAERRSRNLPGTGEEGEGMASQSKGPAPGGPTGCKVSHGAAAE